MIIYIDEFESFVLSDHIYSIVRLRKDETETTCAICVISEDCFIDIHKKDLDNICYRLITRTDDIASLTNSTVNIEKHKRLRLYGSMTIDTFNKSLYSSKYIINKMGVNISSHNFN